MTPLLYMMGYNIVEQNGDEVPEFFDSPTFTLHDLKKWGVLF